MSIRLKLVVIFIALVFLVMLATGTFITRTLRTDAATDAHENLAALAYTIQFNVIDHVLNDIFDFENADLNTPEGRMQFEDMMTPAFNQLIIGMLDADTHAFIIDAHSRRTLHHTPPYQHYIYIIRDAATAALAGTDNFSAFRSYPNHLGDNVQWFEFAKPVFLDDEADTPDYVIFVRKSAEAFLSTLESTTDTIFIGGIIALGAATLLGVAFSIPLTQNLLSLYKSIKNFKVGDAPVKLTGANDEIGQLAEGFNTLSAELSRGMRLITNEKNKMEIIMYNMSDGVLAYDKRGKLIHFNYACEELLGVARLGELSMEQLFETLEIDISEGLAPENMEDITIGRGEKFLNANFNAYKNEKGDTQGLIIVLQDITKHMRLDNMRKEFVANVSHELRTPLTTIKSYVETLMDGAAENPAIRDDFLATINIEADRMTAIIKDLLELSRFDDNRLEFDFETESLISLITENLQNHIITANKEGKKINLHSELATAPVQMDTARINQVFNNIISNSLRYSNEGATIDVEIVERGMFYMVYIHDDGMGIPKEDLRMIFERFYRADKARSRELGGTGLGLSIAKEIIEAHGGRIHASSELGVGTTMTIRFPKAE